MANKFPLILNTSANQIQEIASGDNLDLTGCKIVGLQGINSAGIVTFTKAHVGAATTWGEDLVVTGNARVTGILTVGTNSVTISGNDVNITGVTTASNFKTGTSNLHNVGIELAGINVLGADTPIGTGATIYNSGAAVFTGIVTAANYVGTINTPAQPNITSVGTLSALNVSGNVSIGGTLTYEDVTNIDAVGLITARGGINVSGGNAIVAGMLDVDGPTHLDYVSISGVTTAAGAVDINADLDVDGHTNLDNVSIAGVTTFAGNTIRQNAGYVSINVGSTNAGGAALVLDGDSNGDFTGNDYSLIQHNTDGHLIIQANAPAAANVYIKLGASGHYGAMFKEGAESLLRYNNSTKIATTNTGVVITGICTATSFVGGLPITSGADNRVITASSASAIQGEANLTFNGSILQVTGQGVFSGAITASTYIQGTSSNGGLKFYSDSSTSKGVVLDTNDHLVPTHDSNSDLGLTGTRWRNVYADTLYGDGSNLTGISEVSVANQADNRLVTATGTTDALNGESALTFDGNQFYLSATTGRIEIRASNGSTEVTTARFHNAATADNRVLISCEANQGGDPYIKFDSGGTNFIVGQRWVGTTNNLLVMGAGETAQSISGIFIKNNGFVGINKNNPGQALDVLGHVEINGSTDGVINLNTTSGNGAFARFRKGNSTDTAMYVGASKGMISGSNNVNDGGVNAHIGRMYLNSGSGVFKFTTGQVTSSGIDIVARGSQGSSDSNNATSPFIRFYDYPTGAYADTTTCDDNNWAIGADDSGVSKFKIICGGANNSSLVTNISDSGQTGTTAIAFTSGCVTEIRRIQTSELTDLQGTSSVGGSTVNAHYNASPAVGTYMVHGFIDYRDSAPTSDPDQVRMRLQVGGNTITQASILDEDSNNVGRNHSDSFAAIIDVDGSTNVQVNTHTTDPGDGGGADYRYRINIYKIG